MKETDDELKDLVYATLLGETTWHHFLDRLASAIPNGKAALVMHDVVKNTGYAVFGGCDTRVFEQYNAHYAELNPLQPPLALKRSGIGICDYDLYPREQLIKTAFFNDFLLPNDMAYSAGAKIAKVGNQSFTIVTLCDGADPEPNQRSARRLTALTPHLRRAFDYYRRGPSILEITALGAALFDTINVGVVVINDECRIKAISDAGKAMLAASSPARISLEGRIRFRNAGIQTACEQMLRRSYDGLAQLEFISYQTKLTLIRMSRDPVSSFFEGPTAIVVMEQLDSRSTPYNLRLLSNAYKLSKGETRALSGIIAGKSVEQIAEEASRSRETIRSQKKSLYAKMGATSAADVLRLIHRRCIT